MNVKTSQLSSCPGTLAFSGPHRRLATAWSAPVQVSEPATLVTGPEHMWPAWDPGPVVDAPIVTRLSAPDFAAFTEAIEVELPTDALRRAVARRVAPST